MQRLFIAFLLMLSFACNAFSQVKWNSVYQAYVDRYKDIAIEQMMKYRIPASITLAQGLLESGAGRSTLAKDGNNHFGIKCHSWTGKRMYKDDDMKNDCFRVYSNVRESFEDHSVFLSKQRYSRLFALSLYDYKGWAKGLKDCGYATNPRYAESLIDIIEAYKLYEYDRSKDYNRAMANSHGTTNNKQSGKYFARDYTVEQNNKNLFIRAKGGETFAVISDLFDISERKLASYNERDRKTVLSKGDIVYFKKKRSKADKRYKNHLHVVRSGESLYDVAQLYGITLKSLYKKNRLSADYSPRVGDKLVIY